MMVHKGTLSFGCCVFLLAASRAVALTYESWRVDVKKFEASRASSPSVYVGPSRQSDAGFGVFCSRDVAQGETLTEWVGLLAPTPGSLCDEFELQQDYYGPGWRSYSQRYEIGLSGTSVVDSAGVSLGGEVRDVATGLCGGDDDECVLEYGDQEFVLLGKTVEQGASPSEGVAQLINDHSTLRVDPDPFAVMASVKSAKTSDGALLSKHVDGFIVFEDGEAERVDSLALEFAVERYLDHIEDQNNVALVQAQGAEYLDAPRLFAVATKDLRKDQELYYTYGLAWWLSQLRRAALAQLVACRPSAKRRQVLADLIRDVEAASEDYLSIEADVVARTANVPARYVNSLQPLPDLDDLLSTDSWQKLLLKEQFSLATECPVELNDDWRWDYHFPPKENDFPDLLNDDNKDAAQQKDRRSPALAAAANDLQSTQAAEQILLNSTRT
mmetsp:Transcript_3960/g.12944  ORF Transcript_3960/g.12944 Transcript_3960/m.12944 type:complete len:442 (+) Transcript_3960:125-1450(+)